MAPGDSVDFFGEKSLAKRIFLTHSKLGKSAKSFEKMSPVDQYYWHFSFY